MPGTTAYPAALDTFPNIGPNTPENASGFEHDVVHNNAAAAIAALQAKVGIDDSTDPDSLDARVAAIEAGGPAPGVETFNRITADGDFRVTAGGDLRIL